MVENFQNACENNLQADFTALINRVIGIEDFFSEIVRVRSTGSTSDDVKDLERNGPARCVLVASDSQSAGRGTHGRTWSTPARAVLLTVGIPAVMPVEKYRAIPLVVGICIARELREAGCGVSVKWPNDIWSAGGKAGGILCECVTAGDGRKAFCIGVGINLETRSCESDKGTYSATGLQGAENMDSDTVAALVVRGIVRAFAVQIGGRAGRVLAEWNDFDAFAGKNVAVYFEGVEGEPDVRGCACGIDSAGSLLVRCGGDIRSIVSGSVRPE